MKSVTVVMVYLITKVEECHLYKRQVLCVYYVATFYKLARDIRA